MAKLSQRAHRIVLDEGDHFKLHDDGLIELLPAGFKRLWEAPASGSDVAIEIDETEVFRLSAPR